MHISRFVASNFANILLQNESYKENKIEQALIESFLLCDDLLRTVYVNKLLSRLAYKKGCKLENVTSFTFNEFRETTSMIYEISEYKENLENDKKVPNIEINCKFNLKLAQNPYKIPLEIIKNINREELAKEFVASYMGTTANILLIRNNTLYMANAGDSYSVMFKDGKAIRLNMEHKASLAGEHSRIIKAGAHVLNNRVEGKLNLTRAIGYFA